MNTGGNIRVISYHSWRIYTTYLLCSLSPSFYVAFIKKNTVDSARMLMCKDGFIKCRPEVRAGQCPLVGEMERCRVLQRLLQICLPPPWRCQISSQFSTARDSPLLKWSLCQVFHRQMVFQYNNGWKINTTGEVEYNVLQVSKFNLGIIKWTCMTMNHSIHVLRYPLIPILIPPWIC